MQDLITIKESSIWASEYIGKNVTSSNISYSIHMSEYRKTELMKILLSIDTI